MPFQGAAQFTRLQNLAGDVFGLSLRIVEGDIEGLLRRLPRAQQRLAMMACALRHQRVGRIEDLLRRTVVLRQNEDFSLGLIAIGEAQYVLHRSSTE